MATASTIKFGDGLDVTDEGGGVIRVDSGTASPAASAVSVDSTNLVGTGTDVQAVLEELDNASTITAASLSFTNGDTFKRFTIADATATATSKIVGSITRPTVTDANDLGWTYLHTIVSRGAGTFDLVVAVFDWNQPAGQTRPNETVIFHYVIA